MTSNKPYLLRAFYEWIVDNDGTPYILVDADAAGVEVPRSFVDDGSIVLNVAPGACGEFVASNTDISFTARFNGKPELIYIPIDAVQAIYSRETGAGTVFEDELAYTETDADAFTQVQPEAIETPRVEETKAEKPSRMEARSHLTLVK
jgi:stringent starvation protein B